MKEIVIKENDSNQRLDKFLSKAFKNLPLSLLYKANRQNKIKVNGKKQEISYKLRVGDKLNIYLNDDVFLKENEDNFFNVKQSLNIIYEDENILLIDKPSGLIVHSDNNEDFNTLINHIKKYLFENGSYNPVNENSFTPALCNRIDRNTAGIVIAAKNALTLRVLNEKIKNKEIRKIYLLLAFGHLKKKEGKLVNFIEKNEEQNRVYISEIKTKNSKEAITKYKVLKENAEFSLIEAELITGRTHQIRAQFANIGHPLVGDTKYGTNIQNKKTAIKYQMLYSYKVIFDFKTSANHLDYLKGKTFEAKKVPFINLIKEGES